MMTSTLLGDLDGVVHGFGERCDDMAALFPAYWARRPVQHERHGTRIAQVLHANQDCGEVDGMFTDQPGLMLSIATADCAPVLLARRDGQAVAALHIGWRGAHAGMVDAFAALLAERGDAPGNWLAAIGPMAGPCCYEVSEQLIDQFRERFDLPRAVVAPRGQLLDLPGIVLGQLARAGFAGAAPSPACTMCTPGVDGADGGHAFHSYRRDLATRTPVKDVQWSVIALSQSRPGTGRA